MKVTELFSYLENKRDRIATSILNHTYVPKPIKGVEIPKSKRKNKVTGGSHSSGKVAATSGKPGADDQIRTYVRGTQLWLPPRKELHKSGNTIPEKNINDGYQDIVGHRFERVL